MVLREQNLDDMASAWDQAIREAELRHADDRAARREAWFDQLNEQASLSATLQAAAAPRMPPEHHRNTRQRLTDASSRNH